ncbi:Leucine aminopeptidase 1 [Physocladia obscura]|uniref:Peptide hydrolase n=1 Tax=Physocladia obscura TaxID=109957 RepID=A0AAD5T6T1_9FUNG|nr:Leucine aminopeptidase 1 [Physocladia obscura]
MKFTVLFGIALTVVSTAAFGQSKQKPIIQVDNVKYKSNADSNSNTKELSSFEAQMAALFRNQGFRLISTAEDDARWMSEADILALYQSQTRFIDITDGDLASLATNPPPARYGLPTKPRHLKIVNEILPSISIPKMTEWLTTFTAFKTRYYQSPTGLQSAEWLYAQALTVAASADLTAVSISVNKFKHDWAQFSIILRIEAVNSTLPADTPVVIISAHQDSTNMWNPWWGAAPGADDDGSGSCTIFEAYRVLVENGFVPHRPIEFHWYAAEEAGLLGSQKVAAKYKQDEINVAGVFHSDMTGYTPLDGPEVIGMATDNVDSDLQDFVRKLTQVYNPDIEIIDTSCGYGCSDHASWTKAGYPAAFTFETSFKSSSPYIHSTSDTVEHITFEHVEKFTRIAVGFAVELSLAN